MKILSESEMKTINGGSETIKRFGAWLKEAWCKIKNIEFDADTASSGVGRVL